jgi:hypothetical protein
MRSTLDVAGILLLLGTARPMAAQEPDTLRYHEVTSFRMELRTPQGTIAIPTRHDAWIAVVPVRPDSLHAWYDSVRVSADLPTGRATPDLAGVAGQRFVLRLDAEGHVSTVATPEFPASLQGITDLRQQFADFFVASRPQPLRVGLEWSDTLSTEATAPEGRSTTRKIVRYRVVSDTAVQGRPALTLRATSSVESRSDAAVPNQPGLRAQTEVSGTEDETAWVDPRGVMIGRTRSATLSGALRYVGGPRPVSLELTQSYESTIRRVQP